MAGQKYPISVVADDGVTELTGTLEFTDAELAPLDPSFFNGWTSDKADPAAVNANGGRLDAMSGQDNFIQAWFKPPNWGGALATFALVSGVGLQVEAENDTPIFVPVTYDNSSADATVLIELSGDGTTYSPVGTETWKHFVGAVAGNIAVLSLTVPGGYFIRLTGTHATLGTATKLISSTA